MNQKEIIKGCLQNDREAQSQLFKQYKDTLYFTSLKYSRNIPEAEDNLHDAFMSIFKNIKKYKGRGSFEGWMKRITIYKAIDTYKKNAYVPVDIFEETLVEETDEFSFFQLSIDQILTCIQELPDRYRLVFNLYQLDDYSHKEIASILNISEGTLKSNYHRAKLLLRKKINVLQTTSKKQHHGS